MIRRSGYFYLAVVMAFTGVLFRTFWLSIGENAGRAEAVIGNRESTVVLYRTKGRRSALLVSGGESPGFSK